VNDLEDLKEIVAGNTHTDASVLTIYDFFFKLNKILTDKSKEKKGKRHAGKRSN
jgi:hypothetical protein